MTNIKKTLGVFLIIGFIFLSSNYAFASSVGFVTYENKNEEKSLESIDNILHYAYTTKYSDLDILEESSIFNLDEEKMVYLYPIMYHGECVLVAYASENGEITISEDISLYNEIINLEYEGEGCSIGITEGEICSINISEVDTIESMKVDYNVLNDDQIIRSISLDEECDVDKAVVTTSSTVNGLRLTTTKCNITNFVSQGNYGLCWAATVATIVNYKTGSSLTAKNVADEMGIGYNEGATTAEEIDALSSYGLSYKSTTTKIPWNTLKMRIKLDRPFAIGLSSSKGGHLITGYGYICDPLDLYAYTRVVCAWDSNGYKITFMYDSKYIITSGITFTWNKTLYY